MGEQPWVAKAGGVMSDPERSSFITSAKNVRPNWPTFLARRFDPAIYDETVIVPAPTSKRTATHGCRFLFGTALFGAAVLGAVLIALLLAQPATAETVADPADVGSLDVQIEGLTPTQLEVGEEITMTGTISNTGDQPWTAVQAYLVIARSPFTSHSQMATAIADGASYTGERIVEFGFFDELGDLNPGDEAGFELIVPYELLGLTGAQGIYPVGVQILATDVEGNRSNTAVARATSFLPWVSEQTEPIAAGTVWALTQPSFSATNRRTQFETLIAAVADGGTLRSQLDLAAELPASSRTLILDPMLLDMLSDLAEQNELPPDLVVNDEDSESAAVYLSDAVTLLRNSATWITQYGRPDFYALVEYAVSDEALHEAIHTATESAMTRHQVSGQRVSWPSASGVTAAELNYQRSQGDNPVVVDSAVIPSWETSDGSLVSYQSAQGLVPLAIDDELGEIPGTETAVTLRQRILADAALGALSRSFDSSSRADALTFIDPTWNPGPSADSSDLVAAVWADNGLTAPQTLDGLLYDGPRVLSDTVLAPPTDNPLGRQQIESAIGLADLSLVLTEVITSDNAVQALDRSVADSVSLRWRANQQAGLARIAEQTNLLRSMLDQIVLDGPPSVMLSGDTGNFPLTVSNGTDFPIRIGIALEATNPALEFPAIAPVEIQPGERRTLTVEADVGQQASTSVIATLISADNRVISEPVVFNIRSSNVGVWVWAAMALAAAGLVLTLVRRFTTRGSRRTGDVPDSELDDVAQLRDEQRADAYAAQDYYPGDFDFESFSDPNDDDFTDHEVSR